MKHLYILLFLATQCSYGQIFTGQLIINGTPEYTQNQSDFVSEAGTQIDGQPYESLSSETQLSYTLDPTLLGGTSSEMCSANIYKYRVYMHTQELPEGFSLEVKTTPNSGSRFPTVIAYDSFPLLGARDLSPSQGGAYISLSNNGSAAVLVMEFIGCRTQVPVQFRYTPGPLENAGDYQIEVVYTVVASLLNI